MVKPKRMADCHPDRPYLAKGLCDQCYKLKYYEDNREHLLNLAKEYQERRREQSLKRLYNLTIEQYDEILESQGNGCAVCGKTPEENGRRLNVDHNHKTGEVRGLLCRTCNLLLGYAKDNIITLSRAIEYLESRRKE